MIDNVLVEWGDASILGSDDPFAPLDDGTLTDAAARTEYIETTLNSWVGDSNNDGEFSSGDLVTVFQAGEYEDGIAENSGYATGDWNGDKEFDTSDLVFAFQEAGFEVGPRAAVAAVPEPSGLVLLMIGMLVYVRRSR